MTEVGRGDDRGGDRGNAHTGGSRGGGGIKMQWKEMKIQVDMEEEEEEVNCMRSRLCRWSRRRRRWRWRGWRSIVMRRQRQQHPALRGEEEEHAGTAATLSASELFRACIVSCRLIGDCIIASSFLRVFLSTVAASRSFPVSPFTISSSSPSLPLRLLASISFVSLFLVSRHH